MHDLPLLLNIAVALAYALAGGVVAARLGLPTIVGYLIAGAALGPFTPGLIGDQGTIAELAEMGVVFLMFGVGLHFSFGDLWRARTIAMPGALIQMALSATLGFLLGRAWGWTPDASLILGLAISVASTVVLLRALMDLGVLDTVHGRVAIGWLVFQDLATVALLVVLPLFLGSAPTSGDGGSGAALAVGRAAAFVALMLLVGARVVPWLLQRIVRLKSHEMFVLISLVIALGTALASARWFGVSLALGAFIAGVVVSESPYSHQVNAELLPFRDTFAVLFFVSVGMLVNPLDLVGHWREVLALSGLIILGNSLVGAGVSFLFPYPARTGLIVGAGLGQIGEFSFIVGQTGVALGLIDREQYSLILAGAIVSITVNPYLYRLIGPAERLLRKLQILRSALLAIGYPSRRIQTFTDEIRAREVTGDRADDELRLARQLAASDLELDWIEVAPGSVIAGATLAEANLRGLSGATVIAVEREGALEPSPGAQTRLDAGTRVAVIGRPDQLATASVLLNFEAPAVGAKHVRA